MAVSNMGRVLGIWVARLVLYDFLLSSVVGVSCLVGVDRIKLVKSLRILRTKILPNWSPS